MLILAIDTTTRIGSLAIARDGVVLREIVGDAATSHAERLPSDIRAVCEAAGVTLQEIDHFAVAAGPGSFTGLRVGIATIQGLAFATGRTVIAVSTLEAIALAAGGGTRRIAAWMDAGRNQVFAQLFADAGDATLPLAATPGEVLETWSRNRRLDGVEFHGDGALRYAVAIRAALGAATRVAVELPPLAGAIARIAAGAPERAVLPHAIVPIYVRRPDVELARERRGGS